MVSSLFRYLVDINKFQPDVVVLQIGSNDVGNIENSVENVGSAMKYLIDMLYDMNVLHVIVGLLFNRNWVLPKRGLTVYQYNERGYDLNCELDKMASCCDLKLTFWVRRGLPYPSCPILKTDGVHLNDEGNRRLLTSVRGALLFAENSYNGKFFQNLNIIIKTGTW
jgi:lysophospholipase L1-like esterase